MESSTLPTFMEVKDYLMSTISRTTSGKVPAGAQQNVWMTVMAPPSDDYNEVYPSIVLGNYKIAKDPEALMNLGVTHVVNCACGKKFNQIDTDEKFFEESGIKFHGMAATDIMTYKMTKHFNDAVEFMHQGLSSGGKLYVHCMSGVSRSATIVIAYLIMKHNMGLMEALKTIRDKRKILPNDGFLKELVTLNATVHGAKTK